MMDNNSEVLSGLVLKRIRDGRCLYDPQVKQELVKRGLQPGVSVAALAMKHGVNANLLRKWITKWQSLSTVQHAVSEMAAQNTSVFLALPVNRATPHAAVTTLATKVSPASANSVTQPMHLRVQLPNGVAVDFCAPPMQDLSVIMQTLCSLPCSS